MSGHCSPAYAVYVWWQLIHDQTAAVTRGTLPTGTLPSTGGDPREPGWALTGGRKKNVAIAARSAVEEGVPARGERFGEQTPEEAARLAAYNRYLADLSAADAESTR